jgi:hypothetical protein
MLPDHLQTLLQEVSSVSIVADNAKCHDEQDHSTSSGRRRSSQQYSHSDPFPRRRRPCQSRWESEPVVCKTNDNSLPSSSHSTTSCMVRDRPPVLKPSCGSTTSLCSLQRNATRPSRRLPTGSLLLHSQQHACPIVINDKIKNLSTAALLELALSDISIDDSV